MSSSTPAPWFVCPQPRSAAHWRLICFPHGGGGPSAFREWADPLPGTIELLALNLPGRGGRFQEPPINNMADLVPAIVEALPAYFDKPFAFFGHSVGALVGYEVARRLQQAGLPLPLRLFASAHKPPHLAKPESLMYRLPDDELLAVIRRLGLVPAEALENEELTALILPPLRADFQLSETYQYVEGLPLACPLSAMGGTQDDLLEEADLWAWDAYTARDFKLRQFDGDHFYTETHRESLLEMLVQTMQADVAALPPSILHGETAPYPADKCLHELFREQAAQTPERPAVVDGDRQVTFRELDALTDQLAAYLQAQGVGVDALVGIYMETSLEYVIAYLAILKAGGAYMPLETAYPPDLLQNVLDTAQPPVVLTNDTFFEQLSPAWQTPERAFSLSGAWPERLQEMALPPVDPTDPTRPQPTPDSLAYCVMSSGTTGTPKGIICPHRGAVNSYYWRYTHYSYQEDEREACNVFFVWEAIRPLLQGYPTYIIPDEVIYDPPRLVDFLAEHQISRILFTPSLLEQVLNTPNLDLERKFQSLRVVYLNGEVVTTALRRRFLERFPHITLLNDYSISECHDVCTTDLADLDPLLSPKYASLGRPMSNVRIYLLDEARQPVPTGLVGEIYVGGDSLARGYLNEPKKTAERFVPDPIRQDGSLLFRTGDSGRILPNGHLEIQGRIAFMIKLRGYSIVPGAVEAAIAGHPAVETAVVITQDNEETGQPEQLVAYVVGTGHLDDEALQRELRPYLKEKLPHYAVPAYIIPLTELPIASSGKLDRRRLPPPESVIRQVKGTFLQAPPATPLEQGIATAWQELLRVEAIEATDNFFDLGGHSLLAAQLCAHLRESLALDVSVVDVFQHPTVRSLADSLIPDDPAPALTLAQPTHNQTEQDDEAVAIIGLACRFPGAEDAESFWQNLRDGVRSIRHFSEETLQARGVPPEIYRGRDYIKAGAVVDDVDLFEPQFWGISHKEAVLMDPQHRLFLEGCWHALENAGYPPRQQGQRTGVFGGCFLPSYMLHYLGSRGLTDPRDPMEQHLTEIGNDKDYLTTRVSYMLNLEGPSVSIQTSCSTALVAVAAACRSLLAYECDTALAGASSLTFPQAGYQYVEGHINSRDGHCRPFDAQASGTILGDGVGVVALKRLSQAEADGDNILAVIKGFAVNNDGQHKAGYSAPSVRGQAQVVAAAQAMAGVTPDSISYIECHGTGTLIGDPIEVRALREVFGPATARKQFCALGSVKASIGHSNIAAGMAGLIKTVLALQHRHLPPSLDFETPNPELRLEESPFYINDTLQPWQPPNDDLRRAGVSCFGIGGTNCHIILEEYEATPSQPPPQQGRSQTSPQIAGIEEGQTSPRFGGIEGGSPPHLLTLSARTAESLTRNRNNLLAYLQNHPESDLGDVAYTLHVGREQFRQRLAVTAADHASAIAALEKAQAAAEPPPGQGLIFMFSGQGSQHLRMGVGLYRDQPRFRHYYDQCCQVVEPLLGVDLREIVYAEKGTENETAFSRARYLQPALFAVEYALAKTLIDWGLQPTALVGHSLGEYAAACIAGVFSLEDGLSLVIARALAMEQAGAGAMLSVRMTAEAAQTFVADQAEIDVAVINGPTDVVLSGPRPAIEQAEQRLTGRSIPCRRVHVNQAFHSPMMAEAAAQVAEKAKTIQLQPPTIPLVSNLTGDWFTPDQATDPTYWGRHLRRTVRFADNVGLLLEQSPAVLLEVGPGRTLSGLATKIIKSNQAETEPLVLPSMRHPLEMQTGDAQFLSQTLGRLWTAGVEIDWAAFHAENAGFAGETHRRIPLPGYAFDRVRCWPDRAAADGPAVSSALASSGPPPDQKLPLEDWLYLPSWQRTLGSGFEFRLTQLPDQTPSQPPPQQGRSETSPRFGGIEGGLHKPCEFSAQTSPAETLRWLIFLDEGGERGRLGELLATRLEATGHQVRRVYRADRRDVAAQQAVSQTHAAERSIAAQRPPTAAPYARTASTRTDSNGKSNGKRRLAVTSNGPTKTNGVPTGGGGHPLGGESGRAISLEPTYEACTALLKQLAAEGDEPQRILYLWSLSAEAPGDDVTGPEPLANYDHCLNLARALTVESGPQPVGVWLVADRAVQVNQEAIDPAQATLLGPCLVLPQENPHLTCRLLDVQRPAGRLDRLAGQILNECAAPTPDAEPVVALRGYHRWTPRYEAVPLPAAPTGSGPGRLAANGVYIITGGLGRIGLTLAEHLAHRTARLVLTTRRDFPAKAAWPTLAASPEESPERRRLLEKLLALEAAGAEVLVLQTDMAEAASVERLLDSVAERFGTIDGIFHAAGLADLEYLPHLTAETVEREFAPKVAGLLNLDRAIGDLVEKRGVKPDFVMLFSSIASILGGLGMAAYTAANRFMDAFAQANPDKHGLTWINVNWDDWDFDYTKEQVVAYEKTQAQFSMSPAEGLTILERLLAYGQPQQWVVSTRALDPRLAKWVYQKTEPTLSGEPDTNQAEAGATGATEGADGLEQQIAAVYKNVLGTPEIAPDDNFFDLGGDSLLATQILLNLRQTVRLDSQIQLRDIFDYPTIRDLAQRISEEQ